METKETVKGAFKRGKRGAVVFENELGTLETQNVQHGRGTFTGSCIVAGVEHTRKMSGDKYEVKDRWEKWQRQTIETEAERMEKDEARATREMVNTLSNAIQAIASELQKLNDNVSAVAVAIYDIQQQASKEPISKEPSQEFILKSFFDAHNPYEFINLRSSDVYKMLIRYCEENGYRKPNQRTMTEYAKKELTAIDYRRDKEGILFTFKEQAKQ